MKPKKQVVAATMKDVALKANVSTATVSRALMNPDKVSQATRNRVEQAALEVGYLPQSLGRNMKRNESRTILVIVPDICDPFFSEVIRGIEVTARRARLSGVNRRLRPPESERKNLYRPYHHQADRRHGAAQLAPAV